MALEFDAAAATPTPPFSISGTPYYFAMFNAAGNNVVNSNFFTTAAKESAIMRAPNGSVCHFLVGKNNLDENSYSIFWEGGSNAAFGFLDDQYFMRIVEASGQSSVVAGVGKTDFIPFLKLVDNVGIKTALIKNDNGLKIDGGSGVPLKWPLADGTANQVLKTDGAGILGFTTPTVLTPLIYNSVPVSSFFSNCGSGNIDLYTVPSGKKLLVSYQLNFYNNTAGSLDIYLAIKVSGTYYKISNTSTIAANTSAGAQLPSVIVLNAGETIAVVTTGAGVNVALQLHEFSDTEKIKTERILSLASGDNTLYTVPANKKAIILSTTNYITGNPGTISVSNYSGGTRTLKFYSVKSGNAISDSYKIAGNTSISNNATGSGNVNQSLTDGDFLALNTNAASNQVAWVTLFEI